MSYAVFTSVAALAATTATSVAIVPAFVVTHDAR